MLLATLRALPLTFTLLHPAQAPSRPQPTIPALTDRLITAESNRDSSAVADTLLQLTDLLATADLLTLRPAIAPIVIAASSPNPETRSLAMLALTTLTNRSSPDHQPTGDALSLIEPFLPSITQHLQDPSLSVRQVTVLVLGGFAPHPTPDVTSPLLTELASPDAPTTIGPGIVQALLTLGLDTNPDLPPAILHFLHRHDLPPNQLTHLLAAIANAPTHSQTLDTALLTFLRPPNSPAVRTALVTALPRLLLTQPEIESTRAQLTRLTATPQADPALKRQAAAILPCWHTPRMTTPCPALPYRYRMMPPPTAPVRAPRYQSPSLH